MLSKENALYLMVPASNLMSSFLGSLFFSEGAKKAINYGKVFSSGVFFAIFFYDLLPELLNLIKQT